MSAFQRLFGDDAEILRDLDLQLLLLTAVLAPLGSGLVSPILESLTGVFSVSPARIGLLVAAMSAPGIVAIPLVGVLSDRYGRKAVLVAGTLLFGTAGAAIAFTTDFRVVLVLRLLQGIGFSGMLPTLIAAIGDLYVGAEEATAQGLRLTTVGFSQVVFPFVAGSIVVVGWQYPFLLYAMGIPIAVLLYFRFEEPTDLGAATGDGGVDAEPTPIRDLLDLATQRRVAPILLARGLPSFVWIGFLTYNSIIVVRLFDGTPREAGLVVAVGGTLFAIAASQAGRITDHFSSRFYPLVGAHTGMAVGFGIVAFAPSLAVAVPGIVVGSFGFGMTSSMYRSIITGFAPTRLRGGLVSLGESLGRLSATLAPVVMGWLIAAGTPAVGFHAALRWTVFGVAAVLSVVGVACLAIARTAPTPE
ncbi:MAG: MFS transporter [Salinigranum sp.]